MIGSSERLEKENRYAQAAGLLERARIKAAEQNDTYAEALVLNSLGITQEQQGKFIEAHQAYDGSISRLSRVKGPNAVQLVSVQNNLANLFYDSNQFSQAEALVRRNLKILAQAGPRDERMGMELAMLARIQLGEDKSRVAEQSAKEALRTLRDAGTAEDPAAALGYSVLGIVYERRHDLERAEESFKTSLSILRKSLDPGDRRIGEAIANLGFVYANEGSPQAAEPLLAEAQQSFRAGSANPFFVIQFLDRWADIEQRAGHEDKARELKQEAKALAGARSETAMSRYTVDANALR